MKMKFYRCSVCGKIIAMVNEVKTDTICCGTPMTEIEANTVDASKEKHVPVFKVKDNTVTVAVGSAEHPMEAAHYIEWIAIETEKGNQRKCLKPGDEPKACFKLCDGDNVKAVYAYCNLHGLWMAK